jgi:hypothetical protein
VAGKSKLDEVGVEFHYLKSFIIQMYQLSNTELQKINIGMLQLTKKNTDINNSS